MIIENKNISDLKAAPYNPRLSTAKQEKQLKQSLQKFGLVEPIIYNKRTGFIVGGHFRVRELKKLGYKNVDCVIVDLSLEDEKELNIRLNANTGDWSWEDLANNWDAEQLTEWGLDIPHFAPMQEEDIEDNDKVNVPTLKVTFKEPEELQSAENDIKEILHRKYPNAMCSVNV